MNKPRRGAIHLLRQRDRILNNVVAQALPHVGFRWLYGILQVWNGKNNAAINFTRRNHGAKFGLSGARSFEEARQMVLASGLVKVTREGKGGRPHCYGITLLEYEANPNGELGLNVRPIDSTETWSQRETNGDEKRTHSETMMVSTRDQVFCEPSEGNQQHNKKNDFPPLKKKKVSTKLRARAINSPTLNGNLEQTQHTTLTKSQCDESANESGLQGEDKEVAAGSPQTDPSNSPMEAS